jgi:hypothetical protein
VMSKEGDGAPKKLFGIVTPHTRKRTTLSKAVRSRAVPGRTVHGRYHVGA